MKTILYQPLFINPQAYFVFPQLYHIEKGDSYIEPANITGQLIINDLTQSLTSTPILNVVQDTNQVDFGLFKGKHIRISQYTNIGAVALGEWYIPGTPTPPEPEQPDWFKESIVAWYSPYCKQRMTNFDVIESYAGDFTKWKIENTGVTSTQKKIVIAAGTKLKYNVAYKGFGNSIAEFDIKYTGNAVIIYSYNKEDGTTGIITINRSGIYHLPASIKAQKNFGFYCNPQTVTEEATIEQLPTSILKDFSGNGNHAYLYGGKGRLNSGVGIYAQDFTKWIFGSAIHNISTKAHNKLHIVKKNPNNYFGYTIGIQKANYYNKPYKLKFNFNKEIDDINFSVVSTDGNLITTQCFSAIINNGSVVDVPIISEEIFNNQKEPNIYYDFGTNKDIEIDVELIPDYPNQLCYDGKMYAVAYDMPILTDYTIITDRTWFKDKINSWSYFADKKKAFVFERTGNGKSFNVMSFTAETAIELQKDGVSYQTKASYNGNAINYHSDQADNDDRLVIGSTKDSLGNQCFIGCHSDILIFNRTLTEYELSWVKNNMMCSKPQEPDIDL